MRLFKIICLLLCCFFVPAAQVSAKETLIHTRDTKEQSPGTNYRIPSFNIPGHHIMVGFTHQKPSAHDIVKTAIGEAEHSIHLAAYQLTSEPIIIALLEAHARNVDVRVILDRTQKRGAAQAMLTAAHIDCRIDHRHRIMHHKIMIIDKKSVETGSFNYTKSAITRNAENVIYIRNYPPLAQRYFEEWKKLYNQGQPCNG